MFHERIVFPVHTLNRDTGGGTDWGGIGNTGLPETADSKVAWASGEGLRLTIPFDDIGASKGDTVQMQFIGTQGGGGKGAPSSSGARGQGSGIRQSGDR